MPTEPFKCSLNLIFKYNYQNGFFVEKDVMVRTSKERTRRELYQTRKEVKKYFKKTIVFIKILTETKTEEN